MTLTVRTAPQCRIDRAWTGVSLAADDAGVVADISQVYRSPRGTFYSAARADAAVAVWSAAGRLVTMLGQSGRGPGEFASGAKYVHFDREGSAYIRDNNHRWTVYRADNTFARVMNAVGVGWDPDRNTFLENGLYLSAEPSATRPSSYFHVFDFANTAMDGSPALVRSFGDVPAAERMTQALAGQRLIATAGANTFWAGPPEQVGRGYELELWSVDGVRLRTLRRDVAWFRPGSDRARPYVEGQTQPRPPNQLTMLHGDGTGLLYVVAYVPKSNWRPRVAGMSLEEWQRVRDATIEYYFEVIDAHAGVVLVSSGPLPYSQLLERMGHGWFQGTSFGFVREEAPNGLPVARVFTRRVVVE